MAILIFNRSKLFFFREWLQDADDQLVMLTQIERPDLDKYDHVEIIESFDKNGWTEIRSLELHREYNFRIILPHQERDLIRAARLREYLGLPGQSVESTLAYRNKVRMKEMVRRAGVEFADFQTLDSPLDLYRFALDNGFPLIVKQIDGAGSRNVQVLSDMADLQSFLTAGMPQNFMVEKFVDGIMYHADGIVQDGRLLFSCVSRYLYGCLAYKQLQSVGSIIVSPHKSIAKRVKSLVEQVIEALPPSPVLAFHAEFFHTETDKLLLCEIASRTAGGRTMETIETAYGVNLAKSWVRLQCGLPEVIEPKFGMSSGSLVIPPRKGKLAEIPASAPFPWVIDYNPTVQPGESLEDPVSSGCNIATALVVGETDDSVESRLVELNEWFLGSLRWEPEEGTHRTR
jgi:hypothetical protein